MNFVFCQSPYNATQTMFYRYISTLVWVPKLTPFTYSTTLVVSAQDPAFSEVICIKVSSATNHTWKMGNAGY